MTATSLRGPLAAALLLLSANVASAGGTRSFRQATARDFEAGEATASSVLSRGEVVPGMKTARVPLEAAFAWAAAVTPDGRTAYFGTGDQGRIFAVPVGRPAGAEAPARKVADVDAAWVTSLVARADGSLLAGSTPGGRVFQVPAGGGAPKVLAKVAAEHVWALVHDGKSGVTYAATGVPGKVFAIDARGGSKALWDAGDKHVVSLADGGGGTLLAGTADEAVVYRIAASGRAEALHDFEADEVRAIVRTGRTTYLAVNDFDRPSDGAAAALAGAIAAKGTRIAPTLGAPAAAGALPRPGTVKSRGAVYRLEDDGEIEQVFALPDGYLTSLLLGDGGAVYAAAGTQGKIYRIGADRTVALVADLPERQCLSLVRTADGFLVGTGDVGGVYRVRPAAAGEASYLSRVFDADVPARWGQLRWSGKPGLTFETRSGNTAKPDGSWTGWRKLEGAAFAGVEGEGRVASPPARYVQYRVALPRDGLLREITLYYLPQNQRARVTELTLAGGGGSALGADLPAPAAAARVHSPVLRLRWKVENPDGDELVYRLAFRQEDETVWRPLGPPDPLSKPEYDWNTESVPDGRYVVRVSASDQKVTPADRALDHSYESPALLVDNTRPEVLDLRASAGAVTGRVRDAASVITAIESSIDGGEWRPATPADALLDQRAEGFAVRLPPLAPGPHVVTVRAFDAADNVGSARVVVQIGK